MEKNKDKGRKGWIEKIKSSGREKRSEERERETNEK